ncbi:hypothetical protein HDU77_000259 [Chytriomyces hyalinus]|nr:hypothetical protein HDU77_000259 [Chytriomyces hyalinus]
MLASLNHLLAVLAGLLTVQVALASPSEATSNLAKRQSPEYEMYLTPVETAPAGKSSFADFTSYEMYSVQGGTLSAAIFVGPDSDETYPGCSCENVEVCFLQCEVNEGDMVFVDATGPVSRYEFLDPAEFALYLEEGGSPSDAYGVTIETNGNEFEVILDELNEAGNLKRRAGIPFSPPKIQQRPPGNPILPKQQIQVNQQFVKGPGQVQQQFTPGRANPVFLIHPLPQTTRRASHAQPTMRAAQRVRAKQPENAWSGFQSFYAALPQVR